MQIIDIVRKLVGNIDPVGSEAIDPKRFENLVVLCTLVDKILYEIHLVAEMRGSQQASVKKAGEYARKFLTEVKEADL